MRALRNACEFSKGDNNLIIPSQPCLEALFKTGPTEMLRYT